MAFCMFTKGYLPYHLQQKRGSMPVMNPGGSWDHRRILLGAVVISCSELNRSFFLYTHKVTHAHLNLYIWLITYYIYIICTVYMCIYYMYIYICTFMIYIVNFGPLACDKTKHNSRFTSHDAWMHWGDGPQFRVLSGCALPTILGTGHALPVPPVYLVVLSREWMGMGEWDYYW